MANASDFMGWGMMAGGAAVTVAGFVGKKAPGVFQTGLPEGAMIAAGVGAMALGAATIMTSGSKTFI